MRCFIERLDSQLFCALFLSITCALAHVNSTWATEPRNFTEPYLSLNEDAEVTFNVTRPPTLVGSARILVNYTVQLDHALSLYHLQLTHVDSGRSVPFQMVKVGNDWLETHPLMRVHFFVNLEDKSQTFRLHRASADTTVKPTKPPHKFSLFDGMEYRRKIEWDADGDGGVIDNGKFAIRMPLARRWNPYIQGPIDGIGSDGKWRCRSHFNVPDYATVKRPEINILAHGPLFACYEVKYNPNEYQRITVRVTHVLGYDYVIIDEVYNRIHAPRQQSWALTWDTFEPDRIHTPNGIRELTSASLGTSEPLVRVVPPHAPVRGWPNVAFEDDSDDYVIALLALESSSWRTETLFGLEEIGVRARLAELRIPPEKKYGPFSKIAGLVAESTFDDNMRYPYRGEQFRNKPLFQLEFPLDNGARRTALVYMPKSHLNSEAFKPTPPTSPLNDFKVGNVDKSPLDDYLQRARLQATLFHPQNLPRVQYSPFSPNQAGTTTKKKSSTAATDLASLEREIQKFYPPSYGQNLTSNATRNQNLRRFYTHLLASELNSADTSSFAQMRSLRDVSRHSYVLGALAEEPSPLREHWLGRFHYHNETWLAGYLGERDAINTFAGWHGPMDSSQLTAFQKNLEWARMVERATGKKQFATASASDLAQFIIHCSTSTPGSTATFFSPEQRNWLRTIATEIVPEIDRFDFRTAQQLNWWLGKPGLPPQLDSVKLDGFGVALRAGPQNRQTVVHVYQVDSGKHSTRDPNITSTRQGVISFSSQGVDHSTDTSQEVRFALPGPSLTGPIGSVRVAEDKPFLNIGPNSIHGDVLNLGFVQFAEISSNPNSPSWPNYRSRSIGLIGTDYLAIYDDVREGELSFDWSSPAEVKTTIISNATRRESKLHDGKRYTRHLHDGKSGYRLTLVTGQEIAADLVRDSNQTAIGYRVRTNGSTDYVLQNAGPPRTDEEANELKQHSPENQDINREIRFKNQDIEFVGNTGFIRLNLDGTREIAMIRGKQVDAWGLRLNNANSNYAIGLRSNPEDHSGIRIEGWGRGAKATQIRIDLAGQQNNAQPLEVWLDGAKYDSPLGANQTENLVTIDLPAGRHAFAITAAHHPPLQAPRIENVEMVRNKARIRWSLVDYADSYRVELSQDGDTFTKLATVATEFHEIAVLKEGARFYVRVVPAIKNRAGPPSRRHLVHITNERLLPPAGLVIDWLDLDVVGLRWGQVHGARDYKVYRRRQGEQHWDSIYYGSATRVKDNAEDAVPALPRPYYFDGRDYLRYQEVVFEYRVTAINGLGESPPSPSVYTRANSWEAYRSLRESQLLEGKQRGPVDLRKLFKYP